MNFFATCKLGLESVVARELKLQDIEVVRVSDARVDFCGELNAICRAALWLRCAERVLMEVGSFEAHSFDELFEGTKALELSRYIPRAAFIHVNGKSAKSTLFSVSDCQSIVKKAIVENLKRAYRTDRLPEDGKEVIVEVGILRDRVTIALDACGAGLSRRGYRTYNVPAPLSETLGAGIVLLSHYKADIPLLDPMCGSGTMPIEAAMIAANRAPGLSRSFALENWAFLPRDVWERENERAKDSIVNAKAKIVGSDIDPHCIELCKRHAKKAGVMLEWHAMPIKELAPDDGRGILVCNPPYGERLLDKNEAVRLYKHMRECFDRLPNYSQNIMTGFKDFEKIYRRRADRRRKLSNGGMSCTLYQFRADWSRGDEQASEQDGVVEQNAPDVDVYDGEME